MELPNLTKAHFAKALKSCIKNTEEADGKFIRLILSYSFEETALKKYCLNKKKITKKPNDEDLIEFSESSRLKIYSLCKDRWDLLIKIGGNVEMTRRHIAKINGIMGNFFSKLRVREVPQYAKDAYKSED